MITKFEEKVYNVVKRIPRGKVVTYQAVAKAVSRPRAARAVGNALNKNPFRDVPCHRVTRSDGGAGGFVRGRVKKLKLLKKEGVRFSENRVKDTNILKSL